MGLISTPRSRALQDAAREAREEENRLLRAHILERGRVDLLLTEVMGLQCANHHAHMLRFRMRHRRRSLIQVFRGAGKTTCLTIAYAIYLILTKPNIRILIASKSGENAKQMAEQVRKYLDSPRFIELFGDLSSDHWKSTFTVKTRTIQNKEPTVDFVGVEGSVTSRHYDVLLGDDLTDEENSRTPAGRANLHTFWYKTLGPTLMPGPDAESHLVGTRYDDADLLGHLAETDFNGHNLVIPALLGSEGSWKSCWPEMFPVEELLLKRAGGLVIFNTQYQLDTELMKAGNLFDFEKLTWVSADDVRDWASIAGVDLAIATGKDNDYFAFCRAKYNPINGIVAVWNCWKARIPFKMQAIRISEEFDLDNFSKLIVESNFYQASQIDEIREVNPDVPVVGMESKIDKTTKAVQVAGAIESGKLVWVRNGPGVQQFAEAICRFPKAKHDDELDAIWACRQAAVSKAKKRPPRKYEPGFSEWRAVAT